MNDKKNVTIAVADIFVLFVDSVDSVQTRHTREETVSAPTYFPHHSWLQTHFIVSLSRQWSPLVPLFAQKTDFCCTAALVFAHFNFSDRANPSDPFILFRSRRTKPLTVTQLVLGRGHSHEGVKVSCCGDVFPNVRTFAHEL